MTECERGEVAVLKLEEGDSSIDNYSGCIYILERAARCRKLLSSGPSKRHIYTGFITPTEILCEQFLSVAGKTIGDLWRTWHTEKIEAQMFLH